MPYIGGSGPYSYNGEKLTEDNWHAWKIRMRLVLQVNDMWDYVNGSIPCPELDNSTHNAQKKSKEAIKQWKRQDAGARLVLLSGLDGFEFHRAVGRDTGSVDRTSKDMWNALKSYHEDVDPAGKAMAVWKEMINRRYVEGTSAIGYTGEFLWDRAKLLDYKVEVSDEVLALHMLASIPRDSDMLNLMVMKTLDQWNKTRKIRHEDILDNLKDAEAMHRFQTSMGEDRAAKKSHMWCSYHKSRTHDTADCRALAQRRQ